MSAVFKKYYLKELKELWENGQLEYHGSAEYLKNYYEFKTLLDIMFKKEWIAYTKEAFNGAQSVINYLGRYTHRIAISNRRIEGIEGDKVIYKAKDYENGGKMAPVSVEGAEFIRMFLTHVLPKGFVNADWGSTYLDELLDILDSIQFDANNQTGGIGVYEVSSELGINDGYLNASVRNVSNTGATLVLNYSIYHENDTDEKNELYFGSYLPISKKIGADWMKLEYEADGNIAFEDVAYIIKENEETTYEYNWELLYGKLEPGEYQIAIEINSEAMIYAYFILR